MTTPIIPGAPAVPAAKPNGTPAPAAPAAQPDLAAELAAARKEAADYKAKYEGTDKKLKVNHIEMMKFADDKKNFGTKLSEHSAFEAAFKAAGLTPTDLRSFKVNPEPVLKKVFGDGYYDRLVEMRLNGGAPTAEVVAAEISRAKEEAVAEIRGEREREKQDAEKRAREQTDAARAELGKDASTFLEKSWAEYPVFEDYERPQIAAAIVRFQESEYHRTGKVLTPKEAADALEAAEVSRAERLASKPKYGAKLTEKLKPANTPPVVGSRSAGERIERRTLSNDLTATTPQAKRAHRTDDERMAAIRALDLSKQ